MAIDTTAKPLKHRRTKIVATLGPASSEPRMIARLIDAGVNVFRLNMSHGDPASHRAAYEAVRAAAAGRSVAVLADLAGPKIRSGRFRGGAIELAAGKRVTVTTRDVLGEPGLIPTNYAELVRDVGPGDRILLADGGLELEVGKVSGTEVECVVVHGGVLEDRKGINLPGVELSVGSLTAKDRADARFALELGVDFLGLSFVRRAADIHDLRALVEEAGDRGPAVVAKIEKPEALDDIDAILEAADAIMVARGDLGVELPPEQVPVAQDLLVERARAAGRPVIVATQMLETMIDHPRPTRAEVADISHAVTAGADAVMLSGETAVGRYPLLAVEMMDRVARQTEAYLWRQGAFETLSQGSADDDALPMESAFARAIALLSRDLKVRAIVLMPRSGSWTTIVSSVRPAAPVIALAAGERVFRRLALAWGVLPVRVEPAELADLRAVACRLVCELVTAEPGQHLLLVRGFHVDRSEDLPSISVLTV